MYTILLDIYKYGEGTEEIPTSLAAAWKVRGGSSSIVSESGHPMRKSANLVSSLLIRVFLQLRPLPSTEDQMFWHCSVRTMYEKGFAVRL